MIARLKANQSPSAADPPRPKRTARKSVASNQSTSGANSPKSKGTARKSTSSSQVRKSSDDQSSQFAATALSPSKPGCSWESEKYSGEVDKLVGKCVSYILIADQKKHAIKKTNIVKHLFGSNCNKHVYNSVITEASNLLKQTFGLEILEVKDRKNEYLLINLIDHKLGTREFAEYSPEKLQKQGLVFYLLTLIYMNENVISEDELWKALEPLGIDVNSRIPHPVFGDVKKHITVELVKQMYLEYRCICKDPIKYEFVWGQRAKQEVRKIDLLKFACKVMGNTKPEEWVVQHNDAINE